MVTHEADISHYAHRIVYLRDGLVESDKKNENIFRPDYEAKAQQA
jgi:putative ABC transport system ATP-binding protein